MNEVKVITTCWECPCFTNADEPHCGVGDPYFYDGFGGDEVPEDCPLRNGKLVIKLDKSLIFTKE